MNKALIWLHEDALRMSHPIFTLAPKSADVIFIWDNAYFKKMDYSLKRLVFIYESVAEMQIKMLAGDTLTILRQHQSAEIFIPGSLNIFVRDIMAVLAQSKTVITHDDDRFVKYQPHKQLKRFFQYWKKIEKFAFMRDGGINA